MDQQVHSFSVIKEKLKFVLPDDRLVASNWNCHSDGGGWVEKSVRIEDTHVSYDSIIYGDVDIKSSYLINGSIISGKFYIEKSVLRNCHFTANHLAKICDSGIYFSENDTVNLLLDNYNLYKIYSTTFDDFVKTCKRLNTRWSTTKETAVVYLNDGKTIIDATSWNLCLISLINGGIYDTELLNNTFKYNETLATQALQDTVLQRREVLLLRKENGKLGEIEHDLVWNLAGISCICQGVYDKDILDDRFTYSKELARPALEDAIKQRKEYLSLEKKCKELEKENEIYKLRSIIWPPPVGVNRGISKTRKDYFRYYGDSFDKKSNLS